MAQVVSEKKYEFGLPSGLSIYQLRRPDISEDAIRRVGSRFGLRVTTEAGTLIYDARGIAYGEASAWGLRLFRHSGGWQYRHATRWQADDRHGHLRIEDSEATRVALDAIGRYALPGKPELELERVERLHVAHAERGGRSHQERVIGVRVSFRRMVDGLRAEGPGGRTVVYLDHRSELTGIDHLWRDIVGVYEPVMKLRPIEEALEEVRRRYGTGEGRVAVTDLRLGHFELGWDSEQEYLQPAYVVFLQLSSSDARFRMNALVAVAAAVNAVGPIPIEPSRLVRQAQGARNS